MTVETADAVVVGAGPNGLVAANALTDAGWDVILLDAQPQVGGAVRSADDLTAPGFVTDLFSAFYPLAAASPVIRDLELERFGLAWRRAESVLAHVLDDGRAAVLHADAEATASCLEDFADGDGQAWLDMFAEWQAVRDDVLDALFTPFPPVAALRRLAVRRSTASLVRLARMAITPVRRLGQERFRGEGGPLLLTGNAMHSDVGPDAAGSGVFGWLLAMLGQDVGFPVPRGGAGQLARALRARAEAGGARVLTGRRVTRILVRNGHAEGVLLADGGRIRARRAVLADVPAPLLYRELLADTPLPPRLLADLDAFEWDNSTVKLNWALTSAVPWRAHGAHGAGTVHLGVDLDGFVDFAADLTVGRMPSRPFVLFGQMTTSDATRSPAGTESAWAYSHLPRRFGQDAAEAAPYVERVEDAIERVAPGFRNLQLGRYVQLPRDFEGADESLVGGAINAGTAGLHQQLVFRPTPGLGRPETPIPGLYLAGASAHPGGGVHGACGWNAARAALSAQGRLGAAHTALIRSAWSRLLRD